MDDLDYIIKELRAMREELKEANDRADEQERIQNQLEYKRIMGHGAGDTPCS
jgi:hypothetical protein